jgi:serine phosphatase RsbU (regulator of sigma subunit)
MRGDSSYHFVRTIEGDFGLVSPLDEQHLNLLVCDVSGHGISSAPVANRIYSETITQLLVLVVWSAYTSINPPRKSRLLTRHKP